jgi:hypothetical protein
VTISLTNIDDTPQLSEGGGEFKYLQPRGYTVRSQAPSEFERILRFMRHVGRPELREMYDEMLGQLEILKKEFMQARNLWIQLYDRISAFDEMAMSTMRLKLRPPGVYIPPLEEPMYINSTAGERVRLLSLIQEYV